MRDKDHFLCWVSWPLGTQIPLQQHVWSQCSHVWVFPWHHELPSIGCLLLPLSAPRCPAVHWSSALLVSLIIYAVMSTPCWHCPTLPPLPMELWEWHKCRLLWWPMYLASLVLPSESSFFWRLFNCRKCKALYLWLPHHSCKMFNGSITYVCFRLLFSQSFGDVVVTVICAILALVLNPFIYILRNRDMGWGMKKLISSMKTRLRKTSHWLSKESIEVSGLWATQVADIDNKVLMVGMLSQVFHGWWRNAHCLS